VLFFLRPGRLISLAMLVAIVGGGWWAWGRLHRSDPASVSDALASVRHAGKAGAGAPAAGVYPLISRGTERIGLGPLTVARTLPATALLVVTAAPGGEREVVLQLSTDHSEGVREHLGADGLYGVYRTLRLGTVGYTREITGEISPPVLLYPKALKVGAKWTSRYAMTGIVFVRDSKVSGKATVSVGGKPVKTWVIDTTETVTGIIHGADHLREWFAPTLGLAVRATFARTLDGTIVNVVQDGFDMASTTPSR
jgi:hypothetical protein